MMAVDATKQRPSIIGVRMTALHERDESTAEHELALFCSRY